MAKKFSLNSDNYYTPKADQNYWSASTVKGMLDCPARTIAEMKGKWSREKNTAMLVGSLVDVQLTGTAGEQVQFVNDHPEMYKKDGTLKAEFVKANEMVERAMQDRTFRNFMKGEHQTIITGEIDGYPFKSKFDVYVPKKRIVDLKTVRDMSPVYKPGEGRVDFATAWNWVLQMAIYQKLEGHNLPCYLAVITKEDPPAIDVVQIEQERLDAELAFLYEKMPMFDAMKKGIVKPTRCEKCAYCRATRKITKPTMLEHYTTEFEE